MADILLIDDDPDVLALEVLLVNSMGHAVTTAVNGKEGLRLFEEQRFDVVVTDLVMPEMEGIETIQRMKRLRPETPIIAISGDSIWHSSTYLAVAIKLGAVHALQKPFSAAKFMAVINDVLSGQAPGGPPALEP